MKERVSMIRPPRFGKAADNRRWEFDFKNEVLVTNKSPVSVVFIGDSITHLWELNAYFRQFGLVVNRGIGGDVVDVMARRFEADVLQLKPTACVALIGINNLWCMDVLVDPADPEDVFRLMEDSYRQLLEMAVANGVHLFMCSLLPLCDRSEKGLRHNHFVQRVNAMLRPLCESYGATYVDYHTAMVDTDGLTMREGLTTDGVHPHVYGYDEMAQVLTPLLETVFRIQTKSESVH